MRTEQEKAKVELAVFAEFISKAGLSIMQESVNKSGMQSQPDIFCTLKNGEQVAYELVEICSSDIAATFSKIRQDGSACLATSDPTGRTLRKKLHKTYRTTFPIELVCYTNGRTISPDDQILTEVQQWANAIQGPFRKIWLLGENRVYEAWSAG